MNDALGEITLCYTITFDRTSKHTAARVWRAVTDPAEISKWMDYPAHVELRPGGEYRVDFSRTNQGALDGVIVRVEAERRLTYVWGLSVCEWTLEDLRGGGCKYRFVHNGQTDRGDGEEGLAGGWHEFLDRFDLHLDGRYIDVAAQRARWEQLKGPYLERLNRVLVPRRTGTIGR
jgi:uncharacterized protein YndB with AHSA1/START domain